MPAITAVVDGHVHIHACYDLDRFFDSAHHNLSSSVLNGRSASETEFFLLFTECEGDDFFGALRALASNKAGALVAPKNWTLHLTEEEGSLTAVSGTRRLKLIAGRQVACKEGLEVLLLATTQRFKDRRSIREVLAEARQLNLPHVIPWGAGKWFFKRAKLLSQLLKDHQAPMFFLGDEGGRPGFWPYPSHFREGAGLGVRDLPGTDPLPFAHDVDKVGKMGFRIPVDFDPRRPAISIVRSLGNREMRIDRFARLEPPLRFVQNQVAMQLRKRQSA